MADPVHLQPTASLAERVLLPGDPGRALLLAQTLLENPKMFNHNRGLWGYTGTAVADGDELTIQSTGMGGPSAAIVIWELHALGARRMLRVGTCGGLDSELELGQLLIVSEAMAQDGASAALGAGPRLVPAATLLASLQAAAPAVRTGPVVSVDLFYGVTEEAPARWRAAGALAVEMETSTLFALAGRQNFTAGALLIVSDLLMPERRRIGTERLRAAEQELGALALRALS